MNMGWIRKWGLNVVLLTTSILCALLFLEVSLRLVVRKERFIGGSGTPENYIIPDKMTGHDIAMNYPVSRFTFPDSEHKIWSNELGCFDASYHGEKDFIILAGDSFVWGFTPYEHKWGTLLEEQVGKRVLKCGLLGYGTTHEYLKIKKTVDSAQCKPGLIIVAYFVGNDLLDDYLFGQPPRQKEKVLVVKEWFTYHSIIYNMIKKVDFLRAIGRKMGLVKPTPAFPLMYPVSENSVPWFKQAWEKETKVIRELKEYTGNLGIKLFFVIVPLKEQVYDFLAPEVENGDATFVNKQVISYLRQEQIDYLDLLPLFKQYADQSPRKFLNARNDFYWKYDGHWNIKGNRLAGLVTAKYLLENNLIKVQDKEIKLAKVEKLLSRLHCEE